MPITFTLFWLEVLLNSPEQIFKVYLSFALTLAVFFAAFLMFIHHLYKIVI